MTNTLFSAFNTSDCGLHSYAMAFDPNEVDFTVPTTASRVVWDHVDDGAKFFLGNNNSRPLFIDKDGSLLGALGGGAGSTLLGTGAAGAPSAVEPSCGFVNSFNGAVCKGQVYRTGSFINIDMRNGGSPLANPNLEVNAWTPIDVQRLTSPYSPHTPRKAITYSLDTNFGSVFLIISFYSFLLLSSFCWFHIDRSSAYFHSFIHCRSLHVFLSFLVARSWICSRTPTSSPFYPGLRYSSPRIPLNPYSLASLSARPIQLRKSCSRCMRRHTNRTNPNPFKMPPVTHIFSSPHTYSSPLAHPVFLVSPDFSDQS